MARRRRLPVCPYLLPRPEPVVNLACPLTTTDAMNGRGAGSSMLSRSTTTTSKRDARAADLEPNRQQYATKRQALTSSLSHASLERQVATLQTTKMELETKLRESELTVERLQGDRRWFSDREEAERQEKERERAEREEEKVRIFPTFPFICLRDSRGGQILSYAV